MWIKWKRPGSRGRRGECVCTLNQNSTEPLNQLGLCLSRWFGKLGNSVIVCRLKGDHCLPEAGRVGGVLSWFSLLRPPFVSLRSCILTAALCQGPDCFGCVLWENQVPGFVKPLTMNGRARPQTHTHTHTRRIFTRLINLCLCADGNHRKKEIYSEGLRRSRSYNKGWWQLGKCHILYAGHHWHLRLLIVLLHLLHSLRVCAEHYCFSFYPRLVSPSI